MRERYDGKYEFPPEVKRKSKENAGYKCAITGEVTATQTHHGIPVGIAHGFFPTVNPAIFTQEENAFELSPPIHKLAHEQMALWPKEFVQVFAVGMYKYLRDIYNEKQAKIEADKALLGSGGNRRIG